MEHKIKPFRLNLVTDESSCRGRDLLWVVEEAVKGGVDIVQLREKKLPYEKFLDRAMRFKEMLHRYDIPLIINDNLQIAMSVNAEGIHVGASDISPIEISNLWPDCKILGYSIEREDQLNEANSNVADYLAVSPVFNTPTKRDTVCQWGLPGVTTIRNATGKYLFAIGGINMQNAGAVIAAGAQCLSVINAICAADSPGNAAEQLRCEIFKGLELYKSTHEEIL